MSENVFLMCNNSPIYMYFFHTPEIFIELWYHSSLNNFWKPGRKSMRQSNKDMTLKYWLFIQDNLHFWLNCILIYSQNSEYLFLVTVAGAYIDPYILFGTCFVCASLSFKITCTLTLKLWHIHYPVTRGSLPYLQSK